MRITTANGTTKMLRKLEIEQLVGKATGKIGLSVEGYTPNPPFAVISHDPSNFALVTKVGIGGDDAHSYLFYCGANWEEVASIIGLPSEGIVMWHVGARGNNPAAQTGYSLNENPEMSIYRGPYDGDSGHTMVFRTNGTDKLKIKGDGTVAVLAGPVDLSGIAAGSPNLKITATTDTPSASWGAAAGNEVSAAPSGWFEVLVGATTRYIPFWQ